MRNLLLPVLAASILLTVHSSAPALAQKGKSAPTPSAKANPAASKPLATLFETYWEEQAKLFPLAATAQGDNRYNDLLPNDQTRAFRQQEQQFYQRYLTQLNKMERGKLSASDALNYDIFRYELETSLAGLKQITWMLPFSQTSGLPQSMAQFGSGSGAQPFNTAKEYDNWLSRVHSFTAWTDSAIGNFRQGMARGVVLPKALVVKMIPQLEARVRLFCY